MAEDRFSLKDALFNQSKVAYLAGLFAKVDPAFDAARFESEIMAELPSLELKERIKLIERVLARHLPEDFSDAAEIVRAALPPPLDPSLTDDDFGDFIFAPLGEFVANRGMGNIDLSLDLLRELTMRFSMEFALRPFLNAAPGRVMERLEEWVEDEHYHVRRLVSEGTRPRLPWGQKIGLAATEALPLLDRLHGDPTRYVTRSVSNHLNDIAKLDADCVVGRLKAWREQGLQSPKELDWMTRHALRTLVKKGHGGALGLLGFAPNPAIEVEPMTGPEQVSIGAVLPVSVEIRALEDVRLLVDYVIEFVKANGDRKPKVFKLKQLDMKSGEVAVIEKRHRLKGDATTFKLYPGVHRVVVQINGTSSVARDFDLVP